MTILSRAFVYLLVGTGVYYIFAMTDQKPPSRTKMLQMSTELTKPGKLLNSTHQLEECGYSKSHLKELNAENIYSPIFGIQGLNRLRFKKFEYYQAMFGSKVVQIAAADIYFAGNIFIIVYDYATKKIIYESRKLLPFIDAKQLPRLADNVFSCIGEFTSEKDGLKLKVKKQKIDGHICRTKITFNVGSAISGDFVFNRDMNHEDMYNISSLSDDNRYWFYALKSYNIACEGKFNGNKLRDCIGSSDYGRGLMPYKTNWLWATGSGRTGEYNIGFDMGDSVQSETSTSLNDAFKINDKVFRLNPLVFKYDKRNYMNGFKVSTHDKFSGSNANAAEIVFKTEYVLPKRDNLVIIKTHMDYIYGSYSGWVSDENGNRYEFKDVHGLIEIADFRW